MCLEVDVLKVVNFDSLLLLIIFPCSAFAQGDHKAVAAAVPSLFLTACQLLLEDIVVDVSRVSYPIRAIIPLLFTWSRVNSNLDWLNALAPQVLTEPKPNYWKWFGFSLALGNVVFTASNLFFFVIPIFLPRAFQRNKELWQDIELKNEKVQEQIQMTAKEE